MRTLVKPAIRFLPRPLLVRAVDWRFGGALIPRREPWRTAGAELEVRFAGIPFVVDACWRDHLRFHFSTNADSRRELVSFARAAKERAGILFDVGAFCGLFSLVYCSARRDNRAILFEPSPPPLDDARRALARNSLVEAVQVRQVAAGSRAMSVAACADATGYVNFTAASGDDTFSVDVVRLDEEMERLGAAPTVVKIDVEGAELDVLRGAPRLLARHPIIFLELHLDALRKQGTDPAEVWLLLTDAGYRLYTHRGRRVSARTLDRTLKAVLRLIAR